jgi:hypothetical protein
MGNEISSPTITNAELVEFLKRLGGGYVYIAKIVEENSIDGNSFKGLSKEDFNEILRDFKVTNLLHHRRLVCISVLLSI